MKYGSIRVSIFPNRLTLTIFHEEYMLVSQNRKKLKIYCFYFRLETTMSAVINNTPPSIQKKVEKKMP
jgi:hypothetical protein